MAVLASDSTNVAIVTIVVSGVAIVVATIAAVVAWKALQHDRSQTGTSQPVIARKGYPVVGWNHWKDDLQPAGWRPENTRWVRVRLINRAKYAIQVVGPRNARIGVFRREVQVEPSEDIPWIQGIGPKWRFVRLHRPEGWSGYGHRRVRLQVDWYASEGRVRFR